MHGIVDYSKSVFSERVGTGIFFKDVMLCSVLRICIYICNKLGGGRRRLDSDATDVGLSGFPKEQQTHSGDGM